MYCWIASPISACFPQEFKQTIPKCTDMVVDKVGAELEIMNSEIDAIAERKIDEFREEVRHGLAVNLRPIEHGAERTRCNWIVYLIPCTDRYDTGYYRSCVSWMS